MILCKCGKQILQILRHSVKDPKTIFLFGFRQQRVGAVLLLASCAQSLQLRSPVRTGEGLAVFDRRSLLAQTAALVALPPLAAQADVYGANSDLPTGERDVNKFLQSQGFPPMPKGNGLSPLIGYIGTAPPANIDGQKVRERAFSQILLVRFLYPSGWLIAKPDITENGEAGTLGANNFIKGDSAVFTSLKLPGGKALKDQPKDFFATLLSSQMTNDVYEDVKPKKITSVVAADGTEQVLFEFGYTLLTRAGFTVERKGVAAAVQVGDAAMGLICATTALRYKELEPMLKQAADSFRVYPVKSTALPGQVI